MTSPKPPDRSPRPAHAATGALRRGLGRALLLVVGVVIAVVGLEWGLRLGGVPWRTPRWFDPAMGWRFFPDQTVAMAVDGEVLGQATLDGHGYRVPTWSPPHPPGSLAVACVGDSATFGWPVADDETWPARLQQRLDSQLGAGRARVRNFGVPGWNGENEARQYPRDVGPWEPDVVLVGFSLNDLQPGDRGPLFSGGWLRTLARDTALWSAFQEHLRPRLPGAWSSLAPEPRALSALRRRYEGERLMVLSDPEGTGAPYWEHALASLTRLVSAARAGGARVALVVFPTHVQVDAVRSLGEASSRDPAAWGVYARPQRHLSRALRDLGVPMLDLLPAFVASDTPPFHPDDPGHPGPAGYALTASLVQTLLSDQGWLPEG